MWTWHCHSADPVRGARAQSVRQRRSLDAGYGTDPHPSSVELPYGRGGLRERRPSALARQKVRMPRSSRGCSFVRCEGKARALCRKDDGRVKKFAEKDGHPAETIRPSHAHPLRKLCSGRRRFITDWGFPRRLARIRGDHSLGRAASLRPPDGRRDPLDGHGPDVRQLRLAGLGDRDPLRSHERVRSELDRSHRPSMPASSRAGMLLACGSASAGTAPYAISSCQSRHMMTAKRKAANTS